MLLFFQGGGVWDLVLIKHDFIKKGLVKLTLNTTSKSMINIP